MHQFYQHRRQYNIAAHSNTVSSAMLFLESSQTWLSCSFERVEFHDLYRTALNSAAHEGPCVFFASLSLRLCYCSCRLPTPSPPPLQQPCSSSKLRIEDGRASGAHDGVVGQHKELDR
jgi:hypothetical protein